MKELPNVLICPQHWGLGHVTRTIPVIRYFIKRGYPVVLASSGAGNDLLKLEFPNLKVYELPDYGITYPFKNMYLNMGLHLIQMHIAIIKEFFVVRKICKKEHIGLIVSDARLGAAQPGIASAIITHHLHFNLHNRFFEWVSDVWMKFFYFRFRQIWIPDIEGEKNLSGDLSHLFKSSKHFFIGVLSRFQVLDLQVKYKYAFILSGPEPQRSHFEDILMEQLRSLLPCSCVLVRGTKKGTDLIQRFPYLKDHLEIHELVSGDTLNSLMCSSEQIICRSGYSSLLDLCVLGKSAFLVPTPGQPEQEYLAEELHRKKLFYCKSQDDIELGKDLQAARSYSGYKNVDLGKSLYEVLDERVADLFKYKM
ncbi:MAG: hypothetical protein IPM34_02460 [Saprospiraceae bacterium]|nr:hypothetical protein [Saprospiraceae bacterium]